MPLLFELAAEGVESAEAHSPPDRSLWSRTSRELRLVAAEWSMVADPQGEQFPRTIAGRIRKVWRAYDGVRLQGLALCSLALAVVGGPLAGLTYALVRGARPNAQPVAAESSTVTAELAAMRADFEGMRDLLQVQVFRVDNLARLVAAPLAEHGVAPNGEE